MAGKVAQAEKVLNAKSDNYVRSPGMYMAEK